MTRKYKFLEETKKFSSDTVCRIEALVDIPRHNVKVGDKGGYIQYERNLSHQGDAWVADDAIAHGMLTMVLDDALISDNAILKANSIVSGDNMVSGEATLNNAQVRGKQNLVSDDARLTNVLIEGRDVVLVGDCKIENIHITDKAYNIAIHGNAVLKNHWKRAEVSGHTITISENATVFDTDGIHGEFITIKGEVTLKDGVSITGEKVYIGDACSVEGKIVLENNIRMEEFVSIYNDSDFVIKLDNVEVHGDLRADANEIRMANYF